MIARFTVITLTLAMLAACSGGGSGISNSDEVMIQKGTYVYDPNKRHAPVSLSGADLIGLEPRG